MTTDIPAPGTVVRFWHPSRDVECAVLVEGIVNGPRFENAGLTFVPVHVHEGNANLMVDAYNLEDGK